MQQFLGLIFIALGVFGLAVYLDGDRIMTTDDKIAMLLGIFMILIGVILLYSDWKNKTDRNCGLNRGDK